MSDIPTVTRDTILGAFFERWRRDVQLTLEEAVVIPATLGPNGICPVWLGHVANPSSAKRLRSARPRPLVTDQESAFVPSMIKGGPTGNGTGYITVTFPKPIPTGATFISKLHEEFIIPQFSIYIPKDITDLLLGPYCAAIVSALKGLRFLENTFQPSHWPVGSQKGILNLGQTDPLGVEPEEIGIVGEFTLNVLPIRWRRRTFRG